MYATKKKLAIITLLVVCLGAAALWITGKHSDLTMNPGLYSVLLWHKEGFIDETGSLRIFPQFDSAQNFTENGLAAVSKNERYGYINTDGKTVIPFEFDCAYSFSECGLAAVEVDGKCGFIDESGSFVIEPTYDFTLGFNENGVAPVKIGNKWALVDTSGKYVLGPGLDFIGKFNEYHLAAAKIGEYWTFVNDQGKLFPNKYSSVEDFSENGYAAVSVDNPYGYDLWGYVDTTGKEVIPPRFDYAMKFSPAGIATVQAGRYYGCIDTSGNYVIEPTYDYITEFSDEGYAIALFNAVCSVIDRNGNTLFTTDYQLRSLPVAGRVAYSTPGGDIGYMDLEGKIVIPAQYKEQIDYLVQPFKENGTSVVHTANHHAIIDTNGDYVVFPFFDFINYK